jgi:hypothetical protein
MKRPRASALLSVRESSLRYSRSPRTIPYQTLITPPVTIAMPWLPDTRASPARVFGLVVTRHLFAGALQLYSVMAAGPSDQRGRCNAKVDHRWLRSPASRSDPSSPSAPRASQDHDQIHRFVHDHGLESEEPEHTDQQRQRHAGGGGDHGRAHHLAGPRLGAGLAHRDRRATVRLDDRLVRPRRRADRRCDCPACRDARPGHHRWRRLLPALRHVLRATDGPAPYSLAGTAPAASLLQRRLRGRP